MYVKKKEKPHNYTEPACDRRHYARGVPTFRQCAMCRSSSPRKARSVIDRSLRLHETRPPRTTHSRERDEASLLRGNEIVM